MGREGERARRAREREVKYPPPIPFCHGVQPHLVKLARFWITLATSVSFLDVFSSGYSEHRKKQSESYKTLRDVEKGCGFEVCM